MLFTRRSVLIFSSTSLIIYKAVRKGILNIFVYFATVSVRLVVSVQIVIPDIIDMGKSEDTLLLGVTKILPVIGTQHFRIRILKTKIEIWL